MALLVVTTVTDALTTVVGLSVATRLVERNAFLVSLMRLLGVIPGILVGSVFVVGAVVVTTESGCVLAEHFAPDRAWSRFLIRGMGYLPIAVVSLGATLNNAFLPGKVFVVN